MADQFGDAQHALGRLAAVAVMGSRHQSSTPETSGLVQGPKAARRTG
jgi:poly-beta-hydroxyalkanoate depolymerase